MTLVESSLEVKLLDSSSIEARLSICFSHIPEWKTKKVVEDTRMWILKRLEDLKRFCYVAYEKGKPAGFIEFLPMKAVQKYGLSPCRMSPGAAIRAEFKGMKLAQVPYPNPVFDDDVFISCLWVELLYTRKGIGRTLVRQLIHDLKKGNILSGEGIKGIQVYIEKRRPDWHPSIDWPAGGPIFYEKMGFKEVKNINTAKMTGRVMRRSIK